MTYFLNKLIKWILGSVTGGKNKDWEQHLREGVKWPAVYIWMKFYFPVFVYLLFFQSGILEKYIYSQWKSIQVRKGHERKSIISSLFGKNLEKMMWAFKNPNASL